MGTKWKPTRADKKELRNAAAIAANLLARQITLRPALRTPLDNSEGHTPSFNDWAWGKETETDLYDNGYTMGDFEKVYGGVELNEDGEALVDFYVYELGNYGFGIEAVELICNVQARIATVDGKPRMVEVLS